MLDRLQSIDFFLKIDDQHRIKTSTGAIGIKPSSLTIVSIVSIIVILFLVIAETQYYFSSHIKPDLEVDVTRGERIVVNFDITFFELPFVSIDAMDLLGQHQEGVNHNVYKERLDKDGKKITYDRSQARDEAEPLMDVPEGYCGSCYGAGEEDECCNSCEDVLGAYRKKGWLPKPEGYEQCVREKYTDSSSIGNEACRMYGSLDVAKVPGNFHFAPGKSYSKQFGHYHDMAGLAGSFFNTSHRINKLRFGNADVDYYDHTLDNTQKIWPHKSSSMYFYHLKIVPTTYVPLYGQPVMTYQYSETHESSPLHRGNIPGVFFNYEISPIRVIYNKERLSFGHFITALCSIIGGIFTVASMADTCLYRANKLKSKY